MYVCMQCGISVSVVRYWLSMMSVQREEVHVSRRGGNSKCSPSSRADEKSTTWCRRSVVRNVVESVSIHAYVTVVRGGVQREYDKSNAWKRETGRRKEEAVAGYGRERHRNGDKQKAT